MSLEYRTPDPRRSAFARTNQQTIDQRVAILRDLLPDVKSIAELCCGDCTRQWRTYTAPFDLAVCRGLDVHPAIVEANQGQGIDCIGGDALDAATLSRFRGFDVAFLGPPLSEDCDSHTLLSFRQVTPGFDALSRLFLGDLRYPGLLVCICPKTTTMGDIQWLYHRIRTVWPDVGLHLIHYSHATLTGRDEVTDRRLKYVELWFASTLEDAWQVRRSAKTEAHHPARS